LIRSPVKLPLSEVEANKQRCAALEELRQEMRTPEFRRRELINDAMAAATTQHIMHRLEGGGAVPLGRLARYTG